MRHDHRVLSFVAADSAWFEQMVAAYFDGAYDGLHLRVQRGFRIADLDNLSRLSGLQYLEVDGAVLDDTFAFGIESLRELVLLTRCRIPIPRMAMANVVRLGIDDRPGKENMASLLNLRSLFIWSWREPDLRFARALQRLAILHLEGGGQTISLEGIEGCATLEEIEIDAMRVASLQPLERLVNLRRIWVIGQPRMTGDVELNLESIGALSRLEELRLTFAGAVHSVCPLERMASLRDVRLRGTRIIDGDEAPLARLAATANIVLPRE